VTTATGFVFSNQLKVAGCGVLLVGGEVFRWKPWLRPGSIGQEDEANDVMTGKLLNEKGQWDVDVGSWGVLDLVWPKPGWCFHLRATMNINSNGEQIFS
jgi:NADH dehydrogenase [ubiquinone] 1 alpha subcomplex assembly factor 3